MLASFLAAVLVFGGLGDSDSRVTVGPTERPNIVVIPIDDHPPMGNRVWERLPNIKALFLDQGISFENYWANFSLCCPGRASLLSGQTAHHHNVTRNVALLFDPRETIATELQGVGYHTMICGKYFNGTSRLADKTPVGWSDVIIKDEGPYFDYPAWINGRKEYHGHLVSDYSTDVMANHCMDALHTVPAGKPLFAFLTPNATHGGWNELSTKEQGQPVAAPRHRGVAQCQAIPPWRPANYNEVNVSDKPAYIKMLPPLVNNLGWTLQKACESLLSVDEWLGRTIQELKVQGRYDNTIFILTADNGMAWGAHRMIGKVAPHTGQMPLYISWPAVIGNTVSSNSTLLSNVDIAPTLCEIGGCTMGPYPNGFGVDGRSFAGLISASYSSVPDRNSIIIEGGGGTVPFYRGIMTGPNHPRGAWLFIRYESREKELYDMSGGPCLTWHIGAPGDPCMMSNKANRAAFKSVRVALRQELAAEW